MQETVSPSETPKRRTRRSYTKEFKARLVAECTIGDKSVSQVTDPEEAAIGQSDSRVIQGQSP